MHNAAPTPAPDWCLFLDVDGTLIEFADTPGETVADDALKALLADIAQRLDGAVALVSGRNIADLERLFAPLRLPLSGLHGVERRKASGEMRGANYVDTELDAARAALRTFVGQHPGALFEDKGRSVALHYRMAPELESRARALIASLAQPLGTTHHVQEGSRVLEIKPYDFSKGTAIEEFMREQPFCGRRPVFVGDDLTDQSGLRAVEAMGGISIAVGDRIVGQWRLENPRAVRGWLETIAALDDTRRA